MDRELLVGPDCGFQSTKAFVQQDFVTSVPIVV